MKMTIAMDSETILRILSGLVEPLTEEETKQFELSV